MTVPPLTPHGVNLTHRPMECADQGTREAAAESHAAAMALGRALPMWVVAAAGRHPDLPGLYMARLHIIKDGTTYATGIAITDPSLGVVQTCLPPGLIRFPRDPSDEPHIVETWL